MRSLPILSLLLFTSFPSFGQSAQPTTTSPASGKKSSTVAGNVVRLDTGEPLKKARVLLQSHNDEQFSVFSLTDEQGHFLFENVLPGSYDLEVSRNGYVDAEAIRTLAPGQNMTNLVFKLAHTAAISGHVFDEDGEPIAKAAVITYRASKRQGKEQEIGDDPVLTNDLGEFRIFDLAPGRYYIAVNPEVAIESNLSLQLTMSSRVAQLSGVVLGADSLPAAGAPVVLIPDPPHRGLVEKYKSTTTDQNGKFTMATPGDYKVFSWDSVDESEEEFGDDWFDPEWLKPYETKGSLCILEESDKKSVKLALIQTRSDSPASN